MHLTVIRDLMCAFMYFFKAYLNIRVGRICALNLRPCRRENLYYKLLETFGIPPVTWFERVPSCQRPFKRFVPFTLPNMEATIDISVRNATIRSQLVSELSETLEQSIRAQNIDPLSAGRIMCNPKSFFLKFLVSARSNM